jgi:16S rRNA (cytosine967-C5)-methyltransferase
MRHALRIDHMSARDLALKQLDRLDLPDWRAGSLVPSRGGRVSPDPRDIELAAHIENATLKNLLRINDLIARLADRPLRKIDPLVRKIIGIAIAQILFLDRIPKSAAVDEAVKQARRVGKTSAAGFVNAILRRATRDALPALPDREEDPREYARLALSHPRELFDRFEKLLGTLNALRLCEHNSRRPPTILGLSSGTSIDQLRGDSYTLTPHEQPGMVVIQPTLHDVLRKWSREGLAQAQDPTAASVVDECELQPGQNVLDRCSGLGTKTIQLRQRVGESGSIVAIDPDERRIRGLSALVKERMFDNVRAIRGAHIADAQERVPENGFDRILVDVPCSNSGVLARRSAARYFQSEQALASLKKLQLEILNDTAPVVRSGGLLIYSTCSIWPEENGALVREFIDSRSDFELLRERKTLPSFETDEPARYHDGGYVAVLCKAE